MIYDDMRIYKRFKGCYKDKNYIYRKGNSKEMFYNILEKNMIPYMIPHVDKDKEYGIIP